MPQYRSTGGLDDPPVEGMGDRAFLRFNARLEADQLQPGELSVSENGRMDRGVWQPRRAIVNVSGALQVDGDPLRLPFFLVDTSGGKTIGSASRVNTLVTLTITGHGFGVGLTGYLGVESLTGTVDPNGVQFVTIVDANTVTFEIAGATGSETYGGTGKVRSVLDDAAAAAIYGSCLFSDPADSVAESIIEAATGEAYKVELSDGTVSTVAYPTGGVLTGAVEMVQAFDRVFLFRQGEQSWEWFGTKGRAVSAAALNANVVTVTLKAHGLTVGDSVVLSDIGYVTTNPNGTRVVASIPTADTFTFALTGANETFTANTGTAVTGFTKVQAGAYTQPQVFEVTGNDVDVVSGLCTLTVTGNTTIRTGDFVTIYGTDATEFQEFIGRQFIVTAASSTAISFYIPVADLSTINTNVIFVGRQVSVGAGFQNMPAPAWGVYHQRRLIVPYWYSQTGTTASPVFTDREVRDELMLSDILDPYTYDAIAAQFRITAGIADFMVGFQPFAEDNLIVFNRNSIHLITGVSGSLADCAVNELTREIGCLARRSIAQHGNQIMFLSDDGVYSLTFLDRYNLRGVDLPLSDPIQPIIDRINRNLAADSVGIYFANRYYLAVPLDSAAGAGDATGNNAILVYNFLNQGWESVDSVASNGWRVLNFHIGRSGERNDLYAVNDLGGVHLLDATDYDFDEIAVDPEGDLSLVRVESSFVTRQYDGDALGRKRFREVQVQFGNSGLNSDAELVLDCEDIDGSAALGAISTLLGEVLSPNEDASVRARVGGLRGQAATLSITPVTGRPRVKSVKIDGTAAFGSTTSVR